MAVTARRQVSRTGASTGVGTACGVAGVLFGVLSVYSNSRATCAVWVLLALSFTFSSGLLLRRRR